MKSLEKIADYKIQRLSELLEIENSEVYFNSIVKETLHLKVVLDSSFVSFNERIVRK